ncbi:MAG: amino acid decarboxylase [Bryobacterales bacterium]|nr:amino acid decarboxylase [Bryobacterales bacterium]
MGPEEFRNAGHQLVDWMADYFAHIRDYPVFPRVTPGQLTDSLPISAPDTPEPFQQIFDDFQRLIVPANTHWNHPNFYAFFSVSGAPPGILAEMLISTLNVNHMLWRSSPAGTELEQVTMNWLRQWLNLPEEFFGIIYDTASISTMHALVAAREKAHPQTRTQGGNGNLVVYCSEQAHSSVEKSAITIGIGQDNVRKIGVDAQWRMRPDLLEAAIGADINAGKHPTCIVATVGTTAVTAVDPVPAIADIAAKYQLWLHVDGAYGGAAAFVPKLRHYMDGVDRADSFVFNPHKWMLTPIDLSAFYTRHPDILKRAFALVPAYLQTTDNERALNFMDYGVQLGRRFRSLKLWFVMRAYGRQHIARMIEQQCGWAQEFAAWVSADHRFEVVAPVTYSLVCFRHRGGDEPTRRLMDDLNSSGKAFLAGTTLKGRFVLRLAIGNFQTTREDLQQVWQFVQEHA